MAPIGLAGVPPIVANATNTVALWPGALASALAYRRDLARSRGLRLVVPLAIASGAGALAGAELLLATPERAFVRIVPWLVLGATVLFALGDRIVPARGGGDGGASRAGFLATIAMLPVAVYVGYYGAGAGIVLLALFSLLRLGDLNAMNGLKTVVASAENGVAVAAFAWHGVVAWPQGGLMAAGAVAGGWGAARLARRADPRRLRGLVVGIGLLLFAWLLSGSGAPRP